jgi:Zn-finger in ubiquitin-hydrolases and other protein
MPESCSHLDTVVAERPAAVEGCEDCLRVGSRWLHLRQCTRCGHIGCCDNSPNRHATAHNASSGHPVIRSVEPGEQWYWCYAEEVVFELAV